MSPFKSTPQEQHAFGFVGLPGSGKSTAAQLVADQIDAQLHETVTVMEMSNYVRGRYRDEHDGDVTDNELGAWAADVKREYGNGYFARNLLARYQSADDPHVCLAGIRSPDEAQALRDGFEHSTIIALWTLPDIRFERKYGKRPVEGDEDYETFSERNERELHEWGAIEFYTGLADYIVPNNGARSVFAERLDAIRGNEMQNQDNHLGQFTGQYFPSSDPEHVAQYL